MENARADALSQRSDFISKTDRKEALLKEGEKGLEYSKEIATVFEVVKNPLLKQRIKDAYLRDARARRAFATLHRDLFFLDESGLIRFRRMVYFLKKIRKEFTKELCKELTTRHLTKRKDKGCSSSALLLPLYYKDGRTGCERMRYMLKGKNSKKGLVQPPQVTKHI
jgi:hypothetical protein